MCGRYTLTRGEQIRERFGVEEFSDTQVEPHYNLCPEQMVPVVVAGGRSKRLEVMRWGLIPSWSKEPKSVAINARVEGILSKPSFRKPVRSQRCLVPATGFYEWERKAGSKTPHYIHRKDGELFAFAGIFDEWRNGDSRLIRSFAILTTSPNELLAQIHHRMPVILQPEQEAQWLAADPGATEELLASLHPLPPEAMEMYPVSSRVNSARNDSPELIEKVCKQAAFPEPGGLFA